MSKAIFAPRCRTALAILAFAWVASAQALTLRVPQDFSTIGAALEVSVPGDTVLVQPGTYAESLVMKSGVVLRGASPANRPIVNPQGLGVGLTAVSCAASTRVEDFAFSGGLGPGFGGGMSLDDSPIVVVRCRFEGNQAFHGGGVGGDGAAFTLQDCELENNHAVQSGGAIAVTSLPSPTIVGCRFTQNTALAGGAIAVRNGCEPTIASSVLEENGADQGGAVWYDFFAGGALQNCTIVSSLGPGILTGSVHFGAFSTTMVSNNIVAFGLGTGAYFFVPGAAPTLGCNDMFGNEGGDVITGGTDLGTNFSLDPLFCDAAAGNYALRPASPCAPGGSCGLVGALGVGSCGGTPAIVLESSSWGRLKSRYR